MAINTQTWSATLSRSAIPAQFGWYASGALIGFLIPFIFSSTLELNHDAYYAIYFAVALAFLLIYVRETDTDIRDVFLRNWRWSVVLGAAAAAILVVGVITREDSTPRPDGLYLLFSIAWRGVTYGIVDALLLTAFPMLVAYAAFGGQLPGWPRKVAFAALAFVLVSIITATYHLGYEQFREDGVAGPETGNAIISLPAILTANPAGSVIAHASMHVAADIRAYETDLYLPPQTFVDDDAASFPNEVQLMEQDSGNRVDLAKDGTLIVALPSNQANGYRWQVVTRSSALRQEGEPRYVPPGSTSPVTGAPGTEVFTFTAVEAGDANLELAYSRVSDGGVAQQTFNVAVEIR